VSATLSPWFRLRPASSRLSISSARPAVRHTLIHACCELTHFTEVPSLLKLVLEDPQILKVGAGIEGKSNICEVKIESDFRITQTMRSSSTMTSIFGFVAISACRSLRCVWTQRDGR